MFWVEVGYTIVVLATGLSDSRPPTGGSDAPPQAPEGGAIPDTSMPDPSTSGQVKVPCP